MTKHSLTISFQTHKYGVTSVNVLSFGFDLYLLYSLCRRYHNLCSYIQGYRKRWTGFETATT